MSSNDKSCVNAEDSTESHPFCLDDILVKIGEYGKFQCRIFVLLFALVIFHAILKYEFIFTASTVDYRCRIPECDGSENSYEEPWTKFSIPKTASGGMEKCQRFKAFNSSSDQKVCHPESYDQSSRTDCGTDFIFRDDEIIISTEFKVFCSDEWKLAMIGTINNFGQFMGIPLGGYFSDRYGRSTVLAFTSILSTIMGILRSFSPNYYIFATLGFLDNLFGAALFGIAFVHGLEFIGPRFRVHACTLVPCFNALGRVLLAVTAKYCKNWRWRERILYIPALAFMTLPWILPESVRWLLSQKDEDKAIKILRKAATINNRKLSDSSIDKLLQANRENLSDVDPTSNKFPIGEAFRVFPWRIISCSLCWFSIIFDFMGLSLNLAMLGPNKFENFIYLSLIEIPGVILPSLTVDRYGRKLSLIGYSFLTGVSIAAMNFFSSAFLSLQLVLCLIGKMAITAACQVLYIFTSEMFPTNSRNTLLSFCSMMGRFGAMAAPQIPLLATYYSSAPSILFASSGFLTGALVLFLPETNNTTLPTTFKDAEKIGKEDIKAETEMEIVQEKLLISKA